MENEAKKHGCKPHRLHITTKYGDECELLRFGTRCGKPARARPLRDGWEFELYFEDMDRGNQRNKWHFYGIENNKHRTTPRLAKKLREMHAALSGGHYSPKELW